jgi:hypothetical protein
MQVSTYWASVTHGSTLTVLANLGHSRALGTWSAKLCFGGGVVMQLSAPDDEILVCRFAASCLLSSV